MKAFLSECCVVSDTASVERAVLYLVYLRWVIGRGGGQGSGVQLPGMDGFVRALDAAVVGGVWPFSDRDHSAGLAGVGLSDKGKELAQRCDVAGMAGVYHRGTEGTEKRGGK